VGAERRFQRLGEVNGVVVVDDYGHHPTEIAAVVAAARHASKGRVVLVFQPHRYTRTRDLMDDFATVLSEADVPVILDVYAAGEKPIAGADGRAIARAIRTRGSAEPVFVETPDELDPVLRDLLADGDLLLTMGAGDIGTWAAGLAERCKPANRLKVHS